jgi:hypothetical protein
MKKTAQTVIVICLLAALCAVLQGCFPAEEESQSSETISDIWNVSSELPDGWPGDIPIMDGLTIKASSSMPRTAATKDEFFIVAVGDMDPYEAGQFYADLTGWSTTSHRFDEDPTLTEQFGDVGMAVSGARDNRFFVMAVEVVTDAPDDAEFIELGLEVGQTAVTINTGEEIVAETV